ALTDASTASSWQALTIPEPARLSRHLMVATDCHRPTLIGRSGIPETSSPDPSRGMTAACGRGRATTFVGAPRPSFRPDPFGHAAPERVAVFGAEEAEMADLAGIDIGRPDRHHLRLGRGEAGAQQFDGRPWRPGIVGNAQRPQLALEGGKILQVRQAGIEEATGTADPVGPLQEDILRQVLADAGPAWRIAEHAGERNADDIHQHKDAVALRRR